MVRCHLFLTGSYWPPRKYVQSTNVPLEFCNKLHEMYTRAKIRLFLLGVTFGTFVTTTVHPQSKTQSLQAQTEFCEEGSPDDIRMPSEALPQSVINAVMNSSEGRQAEANALSDQSKLEPAVLLTGTAVRLATGRSRFFLVTGTYPLSGADNTWFWIVRESQSKTISLSWFGANCLQIRPTTTMGLKDIVTLWSSASTTRTNTYKFDGKSYRLVRSRVHDH